MGSSTMMSGVDCAICNSDPCAIRITYASGAAIPASQCRKMSDSYAYWCRYAGQCYQYDTACGCGHPSRHGVPYSCHAYAALVETTNATVAESNDKEEVVIMNSNHMKTGEAKSLANMSAMVWVGALVGATVSGLYMAVRFFTMKTNVGEQPALLG